MVCKQPRVVNKCERSCSIEIGTRLTLVDFGFVDLVLHHCTTHLKLLNFLMTTIDSKVCVTSVSDKVLMSTLCLYLFFLFYSIRIKFVMKSWKQKLHGSSLPNHGNTFLNPKELYDMWKY